MASSEHTLDENLEAATAESETEETPFNCQGHSVERSEIVVAVKAAKRTYEGTAEGVLLGTQESRGRNDTLEGVSSPVYIHV